MRGSERVAVAPPTLTATQGTGARFSLLRNECKFRTKREGSIRLTFSEGVGQDRVATEVSSDNHDLRISHEGCSNALIGILFTSI